jgi:hypothetical protein
MLSKNQRRKSVVSPPDVILQCGPQSLLNSVDQGFVERAGGRTEIEQRESDERAGLDFGQGLRVERAQAGARPEPEPDASCGVRVPGAGDLGPAPLHQLPRSPRGATPVGPEPEVGGKHVPVVPRNPPGLRDVQVRFPREYAVQVFAKPRSHLVEESGGAVTEPLLRVKYRLASEKCVSPERRRDDEGWNALTRHESSHPIPSHKTVEFEAEAGGQLPLDGGGRPPSVPGRAGRR